MKIPLVDLKIQYHSIKEELDSAIAAVIADTAFIRGPYVTNFENNFAVFCQAKHCIGVGNGTDALTIALRAAGIKPGDEVIISGDEVNISANTKKVSMGSNGYVVFAPVPGEIVDLSQLTASESVTTN